MGQSRHTRDNVVVFILFCKLVMQWTAASFLTYPTILLYLLVNDRALLSQHDEVWVLSCCAPLWALWVVLRHKRVRLSVRWIAVRSVLLLFLSTVVTAQVLIPSGELAAAGLGVADLNPIRSGAVLIMLWVWIIAWRVIDRRWLAGSGTRIVWEGQGGSTKPGIGVRPARGDIWSGLVPYEKGSYEEGEQDAKDRPCLVISTFKNHAYVLKITSIDKSERRDHIWMPAGWHPWSDKASWLQLRPLLKVPYYDFRQHIRPCPEELWDQISEMYPPDATPMPRTPPRTPPGRPKAQTGPHRSDRTRRRGHRVDHQD